MFFLQGREGGNTPQKQLHAARRASHKNQTTIATIPSGTKKVAAYISDPDTESFITMTDIPTSLTSPSSSVSPLSEITDIAASGHTDSSPSSAISKLNNSNESFYIRHNKRRSSILENPIGVNLLKYYAAIKNKTAESSSSSSSSSSTSATNEDYKISSSLFDTLSGVWDKPETQVSQPLRDKMKELLDDGSGTTVTGEKEEAVEGELSQQRVSGQPDVVVRQSNSKVSPSGSPDVVPPLSDLGTADTASASRSESSLLAPMFVEVSVDANGGEKKTGQNLDYSALTKNPNPTVLVLSLHFDRRRRPTEDGGDSALKITIEAFLCYVKDKPSNLKFGFLWREVYLAEGCSEEAISTCLKSTCDGLARAIKCNEHLMQLSQRSDNKDWKIFGDNVAIENNRTVYKIFDNRFHPTNRKPDVWLRIEEAWKQPRGQNSKIPNWMNGISVETELLFQESSSVDPLGRPVGGRKRGRGSNSTHGSSTVPYPKGSVRIIKYSYLHGTHFASKVSDFLNIAYAIAEMHKADIIHGDIRGFNMLHPIAGDSNSLERSKIIDFDLCGTTKNDCYPPGYSETVQDNNWPRCGKEMKIMKKEDDWFELGSAMAPYSVEIDESNPSSYILRAKAWKGMISEWYSRFDQSEIESQSFLSMIEDYMENHGDVKICLDEDRRSVLEKELKGTGSPNKKKQKGRRSIPVYAPSSTSAQTHVHSTQV